MKTALVLEGGGLRGAYTAGVCAWMVEHGLEFDHLIGISSGAMYAACTAMKDVRMLHDISVNASVEKGNIGLQAFLREGTPVGYNRMFKDILLKRLNFDVAAFKQVTPLVEYGIYRLSAQKTIWLNQHDMDDQIQYMQAACTLPIAGRNVKIDGELWMDGGVTTMVPVERALHHNVARMVVVVTKAKNFVRKDNSPAIQLLLDLLYWRYPRLLKEFRARKDVYNREMDLARQLEREGKAILLQPSRDFGAKRFKASYDQVQAMYDLAFSDCDARKDELIAYIQPTTKDA
jgi:predicted patatin/cPLA2 family phospholipase